MNRALTLTTIISFLLAFLATTSIAHAEVIQTVDGPLDTNDATFTHNVDADRIDHYFNLGTHVRRVTLFKSRPRSMNHDAKYPSFEWDPSQRTDTRTIREAKPGCKKRTRIGALKFHRRGIPCRNADKLLRRAWCKNRPGRLVYVCRHHGRAIKTEPAYETVTREFPDAWKLCGETIIILQYQVWSADGSCNRSGLTEALITRITGGSLADGWTTAAGGTGVRHGETIAALPLAKSVQERVPADGMPDWASVYFTFPSSSLGMLR